MANYLKLNKSYIGNDILSNPEFNMLGPEGVLNADFSQSYPSTVPDIEGVMFNNWETDNADLGDGSFRLESIPNGYKQTLLALPDSTYKSRIKQSIASALEVGKIYKVSWTVKGSSNYLLYNLIAKTNGDNDITPTSSVRMGDNQEAIVVEYEVKVATNTDQYLSFYMATDAQIGDWVEVTNVTIKETGQIDYSPNPIFTGIATGTSVDTISGWSNYNVGGEPTSKNVDDIGGENNLVIVTNGANQGAKLDLTSVPNGMEVNIKIERVTGDTDDGALFVDGFTPLSSGNIPTSSGSVDFTFVKESGTTALFFRAGGNTTGTTNYYNITVRPTNVFAYNWSRPTGQAQNGVVFSNQNVTVTTVNGSSDNKAIETASIQTGREYEITYDVLDKSDGVELKYYVGSGPYKVIKNLSLGVNKVRFTATGNTSFFINATSTSGSTSDFITLDSVEVQEVKNQPKLIGVDNVSTVSAPTNSTVVINNGLTDGADTVTVTYTEADASSTVQMRNFFQDAIVEAANANNTDKVIEIKSPVLITDIVAS